MRGLRRRVGGADLAAVPEVRHALREMLRHWQEKDSAAVAELLISELVTNALVHTDDGAVVTATIADSRLRVEVRDFVAGVPAPPAPERPVPDDATHGRGLALVRSLADDWGIRARPVGKVVWFELNGEAA
ncbi:ATP-binding protein [Streptomyces scopuliridis]|uniref:ATP-binding protein n=1 Tax=Streptomyces scopuliridis TaxID=452529 RepID=UPI0004C22E81|nr:ATP-binding protein [Streptomyces scopuliridis]WSB32777.1 ATP-binding protein [Streptomyces scopuliridis]